MDTRLLSYKVDCADPSIDLMPFAIVDRRLLVIDQRHLPAAVLDFDATIFDDLLLSIEDMVVRGAPTIGLVAAWGLALEVERLAKAYLPDGPALFLEMLHVRADRLKDTRPTAVNLMHDVDMVVNGVRDFVESGGDRVDADNVSRLAFEIAEDLTSANLDSNKRMAEHARDLVPDGARILTHCNAGALAAGGFGTALGVIKQAALDGKRPQVWVDETRPRNQGARLTMFELMRDGIDCTLIADNMAACLMAQGQIDLIITGADRIAANGDVANKIGTYGLACLASVHGIPFYVAAPLSTFDLSLDDGAMIPIEHRNIQELIDPEDAMAAPSHARAYNPAFDVTPSRLISGIICDKGVLRPDYQVSITQAFKLAKGDA